MPRKKRASLKRRVTPDPKFNDPLVTKFINAMMQGGKRGVAERIVYGAFDILNQKKGEEPVKIFKEALEKIEPKVEVRSRRVGGATYQVPIEVRFDRRRSLGFRWMIAAARDRKEHTMQERVAAEVLEALENRGAAVKKREDTHRMAEANKAFAHYKW